MRVVEIVSIEDCLDGGFIREIRLNGVVAKAFVLALGHAGKVQYFEDFPRPFYKIRVDGVFDMKGITGNRHFRVHLKHPTVYPLERFIEEVEALSESISTPS